MFRHSSWCKQPDIKDGDVSGGTGINGASLNCTKCVTEVLFKCN